MRKFLSLLTMLALFCFATFAQTKNITGRVTDQQGQPIPFATIKVQNSKQGVAANADGYFTIKVKPTETLVITGAGLVPKETPVGDQTNLVIQVVRQSENLSEVVVTTALGIRRNRNTLAYSAQQIGGDDLNKSAVSINPVANLSGKIAGLQITQESTMGGSTNVILRGIKSLTQSNQALFVIDGIPFDNTNQSQYGYDLGNSAC